MRIAESLEPIVKQLDNENFNGYLDKMRSYAENGTQYSVSDNSGKQLTKEQQEYFKDSKVRDKNDASAMPVSGR